MTTAMAEAVVTGGRARRDGRSLTVLYDDRCPLCRRLKAWLGGQATLVPIEFLAAASPEARHRFPQLNHERTTTVLTVVSSGGAVYEGERAWLACGWALPGWQRVAAHFGGGFRLRLVRLGARAVDGYRHRRRLGAPGPAAPAGLSGCPSCRITAPPAEPAVVHHAARLP
jgi:predicted DCC family thiol-disulfide oxidoreductase YuxK